MLYIGNQTSCWTPAPAEPFDYALAQGFDAFEWFPDKKPEGGWDDADLDGPTRTLIRERARALGVRLSVHARWQASPFSSEGYALLWNDLELARDLGAALLNIHLSHEQGVEAFIHALRPLIERTAQTGLQLAIENTPLHSPEDFNEFFGRLKQAMPINAAHVGMCFDLGHANLCAATRNDYLKFYDRLASQVPVIHLHFHENWGDSDSHLPLFTGPAARDDAGIRGLLDRLRRRTFEGSVILEQWPTPPSLLDQARDRLLQLWSVEVKTGAPVEPVVASASVPEKSVAPKPREEAAAHPGDPPLEEGRDQGRGSAATATAESGRAPGAAATSDEFIGRLTTGNQRARSWREKLDLVLHLLTDGTHPIAAEGLIDLAIYLRFLGTGEIPCVEDGRHFRPASHARISAQIQEGLGRVTGNGNEFIVRRIWPWLPSAAPAFQRPEPLTRIRDIAHRNDIDPDLKRELKTTLQNKLHRCAGPEDLATSSAILRRITAPGAAYSPGFVEQFKIFHEELKEFFNAQSLDQRLEELKPSASPSQRERIEGFLRGRHGKTVPEQLAALRLLTTLRGALLPAGKPPAAAPTQPHILADVALEGFAFVLLSQIINGSESLVSEQGRKSQIEALSLALDNLVFSGIEVSESQALAHELREFTSSKVAPLEGAVARRAAAVRGPFLPPGSPSARARSPR